jgi:predicted nuclease with TOPRIM domain
MEYTIDELRDALETLKTDVGRLQQMVDELDYDVRKFFMELGETEHADSLEMSTSLTAEQSI